MYVDGKLDPQAIVLVHYSPVQPMNLKFAEDHSQGLKGYPLHSNCKKQVVHQMCAQAPFQEISAIGSEMEEECEDGTHWDSSLWSMM